MDQLSYQDRDKNVSPFIKVAIMNYTKHNNKY